MTYDAARRTDGDRAAGPEPEEEVAPAPAPEHAQRGRDRVAKADDYHLRHPERVEEFNRLTEGECAGGPAGVQVGAVRAWQNKHWMVTTGLFADGMVGPKTIEAAKIVRGQLPLGGAEKPEAENKLPPLQHGPDDQNAHAHGPGAKAVGAQRADVTRAHALLASIDRKLREYAALEKAPEPAAAKPERGEPGEALDPQHDMMSQLAMGEFSAAAHAVMAQWTDLAPEGRMHKLVSAANRELARESVPAVVGSLELTDAAAAGRFVASHWELQLNRTTIESTQPNSTELAATIFHESRHAEQSYRMARMMAGQGKTAPQIARKLKMRKDIAELAVANKMFPDDKQAASTQRLLADKVEHDVEHRATEQLATALVGDGNELNTLLEQMEGSGVGAETAAQLRQEFGPRGKQIWKVFDAYRALAMERDAADAEQKIKAVFGR